MIGLDPTQIYILSSVLIPIFGVVAPVADGSVIRPSDTIIEYIYDLPFPSQEESVDLYPEQATRRRRQPEYRALPYDVDMNGEMGLNAEPWYIDNGDDLGEYQQEELIYSPGISNDLRVRPDRTGVFIEDDPYPRSLRNIDRGWNGEVRQKKDIGEIIDNRGENCLKLDDSFYYEYWYPVEDNASPVQVKEIELPFRRQKDISTETGNRFTLLGRRNENLRSDIRFDDQSEKEVHPEVYPEIEDVLLTRLGEYDEVIEPLREQASNYLFDSSTSASIPAPPETNPSTASSERGIDQKTEEKRESSLTEGKIEEEAANRENLEDDSTGKKVIVRTDKSLSVTLPIVPHASEENVETSTVVEVESGNGALEVVAGKPDEIEDDEESESEQSSTSDSGSRELEGSEEDAFEYEDSEDVTSEENSSSDEFTEEEDDDLKLAKREDNENLAVVIGSDEASLSDEVNEEDETLVENTTEGEEAAPAEDVSSDLEDDEDDYDDEEETNAAVQGPNNNAKSGEMESEYGSPSKSLPFLHRNPPRRHSRKGDDYYVEVRSADKDLFKKFPSFSRTVMRTARRHKRSAIGAAPAMSGPREMLVNGQKVFVDTPSQLAIDDTNIDSDGKRSIRQATQEFVNLPTPKATRFPPQFCELDRDSGIICPGVKRGIFLDQFYYDSETNRCSHFVYNGCGGNANRFSTLWECTQFCGKHLDKSKK